MTRPSLHPPPGARRTAGRAPPLRCVSAGSAPDGGGLAMRNAPGGSTRLVSPRMRHLRHSRRGQGGIPPVCGADGDDVGIGRRKFDAAAQRRLRRRPPSASRRRKRIRRRAAPRAAGRHRRMRRGADLAASMPEGGAVKPRTDDGALQKVQRVRLQRKARRVPRRNGWELETGNLKLGTGGANSRTHKLTHFPGVRRRGMRTMGCAISTGRRGAAAGARFQVSSTYRQMSRAPQPQKLTGYLHFQILL